MLSLELDMIQYDCPYIATTEQCDVSFFTKQWDFDDNRDRLETRMVVEGSTRAELDTGLDRLRDHPNMHTMRMLRRKGETALFRSEIAETQAMDAIRTNGGYITGPFEITDGSEIWRVGFDSERETDRGLSALDRHNDFEVESRESITLEEYSDVLRNVGVASDFLDRCRSLSDVEQETLVTAVNEGYFSRSRDADLGVLAEEFDISKTAVSKNLRRSQRKVLGQIVETLECLETTD